MGTRVTTTTQSKLLPKVVDTILNSNVFATRMLGAAQKWSGERMKQPIKWKKNVTGTSFAVFSLYEQLLQPQERVAKTVEMIKSPGNMGKAGTGYFSGTGFTGLFFKGFPVPSSMCHAIYYDCTTPPSTVAM